MKIACSSLACLMLALVAPASRAVTLEQRSAPPLTLEDVIFDAGYLRKQLGPEVLVTALVETNRARKKSASATDEAIRAVQEAEIDAKAQIHVLPEGAIPPTPIPMAPQPYPPGVKITREPKKADFLVLIGADGAVKGLYCYRNNDRLFAVAAAAAIVKWRYEPALVEGVPVPILASLPMYIEANDIEGLTVPASPSRGDAFSVPRPVAAPNPPPSTGSRPSGR
ncbi:MAG TPA: hypothetical protein VG734_03805 [Lacunisphaera sp.]|nr:hypothetical protein [Lacunisphaera sp.]